VGGVIAFVEDARSPTGVRKVLRGFQRFAGVPGKTTDKERKQVFCYEGGVTGVDMVTVAFDEEQMDYVSAVNVPRAIKRVIQLLEEEPTNPQNNRSTARGRCEYAHRHRHTHLHLHVPSI
jgi:hypothetical protein